MFLLTAFTSLAGLAVCSFIFGFFSAASSPTVNECILVVTGSEWFNFGYGQSAVFMGVRVVLGAPIAGRCSILNIYHICHGETKLGLGKLRTQSL